MKLKNKVVLVSGGSGGLSKLVSKAITMEAAIVILSSRNEEELFNTVNELNLVGHTNEYIKADITKQEDIKNLVRKIKEKYGRIDVLINLVGTQSPIGPFVESETSELLKNLETNFIGVVILCKEVLPLMIGKNKGKIINFSGGGSLSPRPNFSMYGSSKTALVRFSETLAEELKKYNIDVNVIAPGGINTKMNKEIINAGKKAGEFEVNRAKEIEKTGGTSKEVLKELAVFLASDESDGITGRLISAPWDDWRDLTKEKLENSSLFTLRRIDDKNFKEVKNG